MLGRLLKQISSISILMLLVSCGNGLNGGLFPIVLEGQNTNRNHNDDPPGDDVTLTSITLTPAAPSILVGATQQFTATGTYSDHTTKYITNSVTWSSSNTETATISTTGFLTTLAAGTSTIKATWGSTSGSTTVTVSQQDPTLVSITVTPANPSITVGATQQFTAIGTYSDNTTKDITGSVAWSSLITDDVTISADGLGTALAAGYSLIMATSGGVSGTTRITVSAPTATLLLIAVTPGSSSIPAGATQQFTATGMYSDNTARDITNAVTWSSSNADRALISAAGLATAAASGTTTITATFNTVAGTATLTVTDASTTTSILAGTWTGIYTYDCKQAAYPPSSSPLTLEINQQGSLLSGTASYLGGLTSLTGSVSGNMITLSITKSSSITQNKFTGTIGGNSMSGTTMNGEGCSAPTGPSGTFNVTKSSLPTNLATRLKIVGPASFANRTCSPYAVEMQDSSGNPASLNNDVTVLLGGGGLGYFYSDNMCSTQITSLIIPAGSMGQNIYFKDDAAEAALLTIMDKSGNLTGDNLAVTITSTGGTLTYRLDGVDAYASTPSAHYWGGGVITIVTGLDPARNQVQFFISGNIGGPYTCANLYYQDNSRRQWGAGGSIGGSCSITVTSYGAVGELINGSFSATLVPQFGGATGNRSITNGTFSIYRGPDE